MKGYVLLYKKLLIAGVDASSITINGTVHAGDMIFIKATPKIYRSSLMHINNFANSLLFVNQIKSVKKLTITDPNMTRFLMNLNDSVSPVLIQDNSDKNSYFVIMPMKI